MSDQSATFMELIGQTTGDTASSLSHVYEDSRSEISGVGQRKCNSLHSFNSLVLKVCHLEGFNGFRFAWVNMTKPPQL